VSASIAATPASIRDRRAYSSRAALTVEWTQMVGELARLQRRYHALLDEIRDLGFIATGSVIERYTVCTAAGCRCHADPPQRHGPYLQHTRKVAGKTVTARLTTKQAERYREQIANRRRLDEIITAMDDISTQARDLLDPAQANRKRSRLSQRN
jgi:Family of unknown function (DUF6788)